MKAIIKEVRKLGETPQFEVYANKEDGKETFIKCLQFKDSVPEDDIYSRDRNLKKAMEFAELVEKAENDSPLEIIIYKTPDNENGKSE